jgi:mRNA interferase MazF
VPARPVVGRRAPNRPPVPDRGDLVWIDFDPHAGHEQAGRRPGMVLSPRAFNERLDRMWACPITSTVRDSPFEVRLPPDGPIRGVVLVDQLRVFDLTARNVKVELAAPPAIVAEALAKARAILA